ncbi:glucose PTS transporter subunit IIA [Micropruina sp.]|uniref:glucose PTS transporter subunit IIA n=1 Tax=Micropruina sp. TaxID=2737536 RepID=UPI002604619F|nr:glucose PTS transporter subunit IIA [Micropruina sp.]
MSDVTALARTIGDLVGGPDNVSWIGTCTTRLRFVVKDESLVDFEKLNTTEGVLQAVKAGGQVQVVVGTHVESVADSLVTRDGWKQLGGTDGSTGVATRRRPLDVLFDFLGAVFQPLIPVITGAAMVQVLAYLLTQAGILDAASPTAAVLHAAGNSVFYFLPILVAFTASRKLGANPFIGAVSAAALLHPSFVAIGASGDVVQAFGVPLFVYAYANSMFPALLLALALGGMDRVLKRFIHKSVAGIFVPAIEMIVLVPLTALVFGPIGIFLGGAIGTAINWLSVTAPFLFYIIVPMLFLFLIAFGIHWAVIAIAIGEIAATGGSTILGAAVGIGYGMMGVTLGTLIWASRPKTRNTELRTTASGAMIALWVGGISEPTIYGLLLRYRRLLAAHMIGAGAAGAILGLFGTRLMGVIPGPLVQLPLLQPIYGAVIAMVVGIIVSSTLVLLWGAEKKSATPARVVDAADEQRSALATGGFRGADDADPRGVLTIASPLTGKVEDLASTGEQIFSAGLIGPGVAIIPTAGRVVAPFDAEVVALPASLHAVGLRSRDGIELLIHVGIDTVKLGGEHFTTHVARGDQVTAGQLLLEFDGLAIQAAGYSLVTPVVVTNTVSDEEVSILTQGIVTAGEPLLRSERQPAPATS